MAISRQTNADTRAVLNSILAKYKILISALAFVLGIALMLISSSQHGAWWGLLGNLGVFLAASVAVPFYYELFLRDAERHLIRGQLTELLDERLGAGSGRCIIHPDGRLSVSEKRAFIQGAQQEVCEVGIALRSLVSYFDQRPDQDFTEPIREMLARGVVFTYILLDPASDAASAYARATKDPELPTRIQTSVDRLTEIGAMLSAGASGRFNVLLSSTLPFCSLIMADGDSDHGRALVAPYLLGVKRASSPVLEVNKDEHPELFAKYLAHCQAVLANSMQA